MRWTLDARRAAGLTVLLLGALGQPALAVQLSISSANVASPGDMARVCVTLNTGGQLVAGTQNDLVWDGNCMSVNEDSCTEAGGHGKQLSKRIQNSADFRMRLLVLSLSDVDPIDDGVIYCCNVQAEASPGSCCNISVVNAGSSDPSGQALGASGNTGRVCVQSDGSGGGGPIGNVGGGQLGASNTAPGAGDVAAPAANQGAAGAAPAAAPGAQVLQGGGGGAQVPTLAAEPEEIATPAGVPTSAAANPAAPAVAVPGSTAVAPVLPPPTAAGSPPATVAPTAPAPPTAADSPTAAQPTAVPTTAAASTPTAARSTPTASGGGGWFGCQIDAGASVAPVLSLAALFVGLAAVRRRRSSR